jgi:hypothetical protein
VSIIRSDLVELSGFINWFPTIEPVAQMESFTYSMSLTMPEDWVVLSPHQDSFRALRGGEMEFVQNTSPAADIFIIASPDFEAHTIGAENSPIRLYAVAMDKLDLLKSDFEKVVSIGTSWFGKPKTTRAIVAVVSPRRGGAEWGYKRGAIWVVGYGFANNLLDHDWVARGLKKSLAAHETIHSWFGESVDFEHPYHAEAITQYVEVVLTAELFGQLDLAEQYFDSYKTRFLETLAKRDVAISSLTVDQDTYDYWYLKGSWAFWDLEAKVGRTTLLKTLSYLHENASNEPVSAEELVEFFSRSLGEDLGPFFTHWFDEKGFKPLYRTKVNDS